MGVGVALGAVTVVGVAGEVGVADGAVTVGVADEGVTGVGVAFALDLVGLAGGSRGLGTGFPMSLDPGRLCVLVADTFLAACSSDTRVSSLEGVLSSEL